MKINGGQYFPLMPNLVHARILAQRILPLCVNELDSALYSKKPIQIRLTSTDYYILENDFPRQYEDLKFTVSEVLTVFLEDVLITLGMKYKVQPIIHSVDDKLCLIARVGLRKQKKAKQG